MAYVCNEKDYFNMRAEGRNTFIMPVNGEMNVRIECENCEWVSFFFLLFFYQTNNYVFMYNFLVWLQKGN